MGIHGVQIHCSVTVIILRRAVLHHRREPQRGYAKFLQIRQMILDSAQVAAMVRARFRSIVRAGCFRRLVVRRIPIRKTVRHDQVNHIIRRQTLKFAERWHARCQRQLERRRAFRRRNPANCRSRPRVRPDFQPDKKILAARCGLCARNPQRRQIARDLRGLQVLPRKQQHHSRRESHPPIRRLDLCHFHCRSRRILLQRPAPGSPAQPERPNDHQDHASTKVHFSF